MLRTLKTLTDHTAAYTAAEPPDTTAALATEMRGHLAALRLVRAAAAHQGMLPAEVLSDLRRLRFHRGEAEIAVGREDTTDTTHHLTQAYIAAERIAAYLRETGVEVEGLEELEVTL